MKPPIHMAGLLLLPALFLLAGVAGYKAYLASPETPRAAPQPSRHEAVATGAVLFIIDGFHPGRAFDPEIMPTFAGLAARGASGIVTSERITLTGPCIYSLTTGRPGTLGRAILNFDSPETRVDSLLSLMVDSGRKVVVSGDPVWDKQFGWLIPKDDRYAAPEAGITTSSWIDENDSESIDFLLNKMQDEGYGLSIVHLGSVDAVGHMVTPLHPRYYQQLTFADSLLARVVEQVDFEKTLLLVTGDHGMADRGTHGGEEQARLTPYLLAGPGIQTGAVKDLPQTALASTLSALLGLPFLPVSEHPPATALFEIAPHRSRQMKAEYFQAKAAAAGVTVSGEGGMGEMGNMENRLLNESLFGNDSNRLLWRWAAVIFGLAGFGVAFVQLWATRPAERPGSVEDGQHDSDPAALAQDRPLQKLSLFRFGGSGAGAGLAAQLSLALAVPAMMGLGAALFIWSRDLFPFRSSQIAMVMAVAILTGSFAAGWFSFRSRALWKRLQTLQLPLFFSILVVLTLPLMTSRWSHPGPYFGFLFLALVAALCYYPKLRQQGWNPKLLLLPASTLPAIFTWPLPDPISTWLIPILSLLLLILTLRHQPPTTSHQPPATNHQPPTTSHQPPTTSHQPPATSMVLLTIIISTALLYHLGFGNSFAAFGVLLLFVLLVTLELWDGGRSRKSGSVMIAASAALFLTLASDEREALVFLAAALAALAVSRMKLDLRQTPVLYAAAGMAILFRICLYFALGDQYRLSSIRTAPGFLLTDHGLPLDQVTLFLVLKYALPWFLILGMLAPSLREVGGRVAAHFAGLLALGYVARFVTAVVLVNPLSSIPNALESLVGVYAISWAELVTFSVAASLCLFLKLPQPLPSTNLHQTLAP